MVAYNRLFDDSYTRVHVNFDDFIAEFYQHFSVSSVEITQLFGDTDMEKQKNMLKSSFEHLVRFHHSRNASDELLRLAQLHRDMQVTDEMYAAWMESLIKAVNVIDYECNDEIELAWRIVLAPGIEFMKHAAK